MTKKLYGIMPYTFLAEPLIVAGVCFESHRAGLRNIREEQDIDRFRELNRMFVDELGRRSEMSTWFLLDVDEEVPSADVDIAYARLMAAVQFSLLERGDYREQPAAQTVDAHLFELMNAFPPEGNFWQSRGCYTRSVHAGPREETIYPRSPNIRFPDFPADYKVAEILAKLVSPDTSLLELAGSDHALLDSLSLFVQACSSPEVSDIRARIVLLAAAFEILLGIKGVGKGKSMARKVESLLRSSFVDWKPREMERQLENVLEFCEEFYVVRCKIMHHHSPRSQELLFKPKGSSAGFIGFFPHARQLYAACVHARIGMLEDVAVSLILADLVSNEDRLARIVSNLTSGDSEKEAEALALCSELKSYQGTERLEHILDAWHELADFYSAWLQRQGLASHPLIERSMNETDPIRLAGIFRRISEAVSQKLPMVIRGKDFEMLSMHNAVLRFADYASHAVMLRAYQR